MEDNAEYVDLASATVNNISNEEDDIQALDIFGAVKEILQSFLCQSKRISVRVSIKSTKNSQNSPRKSWFYIKVSTPSALDMTLLEDRKRNPALYAVLRYMQDLENESHLCIQYPSNNEGEGHSSVQQNLILEGDGLNVLSEVTRSKGIKDSTLHLRVHQPVWHMMKDCTKIHSYLAQIRLFRPKAEMRFTMKVGEAVSQTDFTIQNKRKLLQTLPPVVTDSEFYLQDSGLIALSETVITFTVDPVLLNMQCVDFQNEFRNTKIQLSPLASYIPVEGGVSSIVTLTFYGPGYMPLGMAGAYQLLEDIVWSKFGLKRDQDLTVKNFKGLLTSHTSVVLKPSHVGNDIGNFTLSVFLLLETLDITDKALGQQLIEKNIESLLKEHGSKLRNVLQRLLDKVFLPVLNNAKNRSLVIRSIESICKAVTDVVSMSSNEQFRASVLQSLKVADTVELKAVLNHQLTEISHKKHPGIWMRSSYLKVKDGAESKDLSGVNEKVNTDKNTGGVIDEDAVVTAEEEAHIDEKERIQTSQVDPNKFSDGDHDNSIKRPRKLYSVVDNQVLKVSAFPFHPCQKKHAAICDFDETRIKSDVDKAIDEKKFDDNGNSDKENKPNTKDKTPDISEIIKNMDKVSPFHQLAQDSPTAGMDITPDVSKIIQGMKDVSPFLELACEDKVGSRSPQVYSEDPCDGQVVPEVVPAGEMPFARYRHELDSQFITQKDPGLAMAHCEMAYPATPISTDFVKGFENDTCNTQDERNCRSSRNHCSQIKVPVSDTDFELLSSDEFVPTLEVVSNFIDEVGCFGESLSVTDSFLKGHDLSKYAGESCFKKLDVNDNGEYGTAAGKMAECLEEPGFDQGTCVNHDNDLVEDAGTKQEERDYNKDLDDWFNDVLMEVEEWLP